MICRTAGHNIYLGKPVQFLSGEGNSIQLYHALFIKTAVYSFAYALRLLEDFLEHKVLIAFLFGGVHIPGHMENLAFHRGPVLVKYFHAVRGHHHHLAVFYKVDFLYIFKKRRNIRSNEIASFAKTCNQRCILSYGYQFIRIIGRNCHYCICAPHTAHGLVNSILQTIRLLHIKTD